jgi:hypothetical protein
MNERVLTRAVFLGGLLLGACGPQTDDGDEPSAQDLAAIAQRNIEQALRGTHRAGSFLADSAMLADSLGALAGSSTTCSQACDANGCAAEECVTTKETITVDDLHESRDDLNDSIDDLMQALRDKVFTAENLEAEGDGSATYLLGPKFWCAPLIEDSPPPSSGSGGSASNVGQPGTPALDPDCVDEAKRLQIRLRLSSPSDDNVDVALLLTASKQNPATLELYTNHVGVTVDLGEIKDTLDALGEDTGSITSLVGKLGFSLKRNAELDYSFLASVLEDVKVGSQNDAGADAVYGIGKSVPTFELRFDGNARKITGTLDVGAVTAEGPLNAFRDFFDSEEYDDFGEPLPRKNYQGTLHALLAGLEAGVAFDGSSDALTLTHVGAGDQSSTLKLDQNTLLQLDVNPAAGRHFDLGIAKAGSETRLTFLPTLDTRAVLKFAPLASQIADISPTLLDNTLHLWFDGQNPSVETRDDALRVVGGTLNYTDAYEPSNDFTAAAGSCIADADGGDSSSAAQFVVTTCQ